MSEMVDTYSGHLGGVGAGAPGDEIDITREMIAAGVHIVHFIGPSELGSMTEENLVSAVYRAMGEERRRDLCPRARA